MIDNWRWADVPFYLRTGKALRGKQTEVAIKFKQAPIAMFRDTPVDRLAENFLVIGIQPNECIGLEFNAKVPGPSIALGGVSMTFRYDDYFEAAPSTGYETLIYDCMTGDAIFIRAPTASRPAGAWCSRFSTRFATLAIGNWQNIAPEARVRKRRTNYSRATDVAGGRSVEFVMTAAKQPQIVTVADPRFGRGGTVAAVARPDQSRRPRSSVSHRWLESAWFLPLARGRSLAQPSAVGSRALVHGRRSFRARERPVEQYGRGETHFSRSGTGAPAKRRRFRPTPTAPRAPRDFMRTSLSGFMALIASIQPDLYLTSC